MPIYAYRCSHCGHAQDVLQRMADPVLTVCPACGQTTYVKQVTAAGFQLKGSGWYVTDFRGDNKPAKSAEAGEAGAEAPKDAGNGKSADAPAGGTETKTESKGGEVGKKTDAAPAPAAAPSPAPAPTTPVAPASSGKTGS